MLRILVTDGGSVNALGIVRQLGALKQFELYVVGYNKTALCKFSRYCRKFFLTPHPKKQPESFIQRLEAICKSESIDFVLPVGFYAHGAIIEHSARITALSKVCLPSLDSFLTASSKVETARIAESVGVKVPKTVIVSHLDELQGFGHLRFPLVIKARKEIGGRMVEYAHTHGELVSKFTGLVNTFKLDVADYPIIQEYIQGEGVGWFAFYKQGQLQRSFMHVRVREFPVSGGRSVCAKSFHDEKLHSNGKRLLDALNWNGCAMVEFKRTADNEFYLLEVNPKLWGSLELAICSGVNFPLLMIQDAFSPSPAATENSYTTNLYFQWCLNGELYHFFNRPLSIFRIIGTAFRSKKDIWLKDIKPNFIQLLLILVDLYKVLKPKTKS